VFLWLQGSSSAPACISNQNNIPAAAGRRVGNGRLKSFHIGLRLQEARLFSKPAHCALFLPSAPGLFLTLSLITGDLCLVLILAIAIDPFLFLALLLIALNPFLLLALLLLLIAFDLFLFPALLLITFDPFLVLALPLLTDGLFLILDLLPVPFDLFLFPALLRIALDLFLILILAIALDPFLFLALLLLTSGLFLILDLLLIQPGLFLVLTLLLIALIAPHFFSLPFFLIQTFLFPIFPGQTLTFQPQAITLNFRGALLPQEPFALLLVTPDLRLILLILIRIIGILI
jgi:hypothetical protein